MFVHVDLEVEGENILRWTPGTHGLVRFGGEPAIVSDNLIHELQKRLARLQSLKAEKKHLRKGDRVRIVKGPFEGYEAIFDMHLSGKDRVQVLLAYLNSQPQRIRLNATALEKVS
jgi:transcriptional antiterminator RfaH